MGRRRKKRGGFVGDVSENLEYSPSVVAESLQERPTKSLTFKASLARHRRYKRLEEKHRLRVRRRISARKLQRKRRRMRSIAVWCRVVSKVKNTIVVWTWKRKEAMNSQSSPTTGQRKSRLKRGNTVTAAGNRRSRRGQKIMVRGKRYRGTRYSAYKTRKRGRHNFEKGRASMGADFISARKETGKSGTFVQKVKPLLSLTANGRLTEVKKVKVTPNFPSKPSKKSGVVTGSNKLQGRSVRVHLRRDGVGKGSKAVRKVLAKQGRKVISRSSVARQAHNGCKGKAKRRL